MVPRSALLKLSQPKEPSDAHQNAELQVPGPCRVDMVKIFFKGPS